MKIRLALTAGFLLNSFIVSAQAATPVIVSVDKDGIVLQDRYVTNGLFAQLSLDYLTNSGKSGTLEDDLDADSTWGADYAWGVNLGLGYGFRQNRSYFGVEAVGNFFPKRQSITAESSGESIDVRNPWGVDFEGQLGYYFSPNALAYLSMGIALSKFESYAIEDGINANKETKNSRNLWAALPGVGARFAISDNLALGMSYKWYIFENWHFADQFIDGVSHNETRLSPLQNIFALNATYTFG